MTEDEIAKAHADVIGALTVWESHAEEADEYPAIRTIRERTTALLDALEAAERGVLGLRGQIIMTVARLAGEVEGLPTHTGNFLQRIDALHAAESRAATTRAEVISLRSDVGVRDIEIARLRAENVRLREALEDLLDLFATDEEGATGHYDRIAMEFYEETRIWPPGKSAPMGMYLGDMDDKERHRTWTAWIESRRSTRVAAARRALATTKPGEGA